MDPNQILGALLGPQLWWLWEGVIFGLYIAYNFFKPYGKAMCIVLEQINHTWVARKPRFIGLSEKSWQARKGESHTLAREMDKAGYIASDPLNSYPVVFYRRGRTRPMYVHFEELEHSPKNDKYNPKSDVWDAFAKDEAYKQAKDSNKTNQKTPIAMLVLVAIAAGSIAFMLAYLFLPPHYIPLPSTSAITTAINGTTTTIPGNGAVTQTISSSSSSSCQLIGCQK